MSRNEIGLNITPGLAELRAARRESKRLILAVFLFSVAVNLLLLTGPLYMLQVYDRVLGSRSEPTLFALTALIVFLFLVMGILDHARGRVMARVGAAFQARLDRRTFEAALKRAQVAPGDPAAAAAQRDLRGAWHHGLPRACTSARRSGDRGHRQAALREGSVAAAGRRAGAAGR